MIKFGREMATMMPIVKGHRNSKDVQQQQQESWMTAKSCDESANHSEERSGGTGAGITTRVTKDKGGILT